jgi:hypothetical protein
VSIRGYSSQVQRALSPLQLIVHTLKNGNLTAPDRYRVKVIKYFPQKTPHGITFSKTSKDETTPPHRCHTTSPTVLDLIIDNQGHVDKRCQIENWSRSKTYSTWFFLQQTNRLGTPLQVSGFLKNLCKRTRTVPAYGRMTNTQSLIAQRTARSMSV